MIVFVRVGIRPLRALIAALSVLLLLMAGSFFVVSGLFDRNQAIATVVVGFFVNASAALFAVLIGLSRLETLLLRMSNVRKFGPVAEFWTVPSTGKPWFVLFGGRQSSDPGDPELRVSFSTVFAFSRISEVIKQLYGPDTVISLKCIRDIDDWGFVSTSNVVVLGGVVSIPKMMDVFELLPLSARQELCGGIRQIVISDEFARTCLPSKVENNLVVEDHALVTRTINLHNQSSLFTVSGGCGVGTGAATLAVTSMGHFNTTGFSRKASFNEVVVSAKDIIGGQIYRGEPTVHCRTWRHVDMDRRSLSEVSRKLSEKMLL